MLLDRHNHLLEPFLLRSHRGLRDEERYRGARRSPRIALMRWSPRPVDFFPAGSNGANLWIAMALMVVVYAAALGGLLAWIGWLWRRTPAPVWTGLVALVPVGLGAWCVVAMAAAFSSACRVAATLTSTEQGRLVAMHETHAYRWGMRFWAAGLVSAGWLLFVMWRWDALEQPPRGTQ